MGPPAAGGSGGGGGLPPWLLPVLGGVIAVFVVAIGVLLLTGDDDDGDDTDLVGGSGDGDTEETDEDDADTGGTGEGEGEGDEPGEGGADEPQYDPERLTGTWEGTYDCGDGGTDLVLTVDDYPGETGVAANWWADPDGDNEGMYYMDGTYEDGQLSLTGDRWDEEFEDRDESDMYGLEADLSGFTGTEPMAVTLDGEGCGDVTLERTSQDPWWVGAFEGTYLCAQGITGASVTIEATGQDSAYAFFEFYETDDSEGPVSYGSMHMDGNYTDRTMRLEMTNWERQPPGYVAVPIASAPEVGIHPDRFSGYLEDEGCGLFGLNRVEETEAADEAEDEAAGGGETGGGDAEAGEGGAEDEDY